MNTPWPTRVNPCSLKRTELGDDDDEKQQDRILLEQPVAFASELHIVCYKEGEHQGSGKSNHVGAYDQRPAKSEQHRRRR
jgi:hypothetical protein